MLTAPSNTTTETPDARLRLVAATARLVHADSYHAVGVKAICDEAGVQRGSFYHFFPSKTALMLEAINHAWDEFEQEGLGVCRDTSLTSRQRLESVFDYLHDCQRGHVADTGAVLGCLFGNLAAELTTSDEEIRLRLKQAFDEWASAFEVPLADACRDGEVISDRSPRDLAVAVVAELEGLITLAKVQNDPGILESGGRAIVERLWQQREKRP